MKSLSLAAVPAVLVLSLLFIPRCGDGDVMARAGGHEITRGHLVRWLEARGDDPDAVMAKKEEQRLRLRRLALELLATDEARRVKFDRSDDFLFLASHLERNFCVNFFDEWMKENEWFEGEVAKVSLFRIPVKGDGARRDAIRQKTREVAVALAKGATAGELTKQYGDLAVQASEVYVAPGMKELPCADPVFSLKEGEIIAEPVEADGILYIARMLAKHRVNPGNFNDVFNDGGDHGAIKQLLIQRTLEYLEKRLLDDGDVIDETMKAGDGVGGSVLFSVGKEKFTNDDLYRLLRLVYSSQWGEKGPARYTKKMQLDWAKNVMTDMLLYRYIRGKGICDGQKYKESWNATKQQALATRYFDEKIISAVVIADSDVLNEYVREKDLLKNAVKKGIVSREDGILPPLYQIEDTIRKDLIKRKRISVKQKWESDLLAKSGFVVVEEELNGR